MNTSKNEVAEQHLIHQRTHASNNGPPIGLGVENKQKNKRKTENGNNVNPTTMESHV